MKSNVIPNGKSHHQQQPQPSLINSTSSKNVKLDSNLIKHQQPSSTSSSNNNTKYTTVTTTSSTNTTKSSSSSSVPQQINAKNENIQTQQQQKLPMNHISSNSSSNIKDEKNSSNSSSSNKVLENEKKIPTSNNNKKDEYTTDDEDGDDEDINLHLSPRTLKKLHDIQSKQELAPKFIHSLQNRQAIQNIPKLPNWTRERAFLNNGFLANNTNIYKSNHLPAKYEKTKISLGKLPLNVQEQSLIEDLLSAMIGIEGETIHISTEIDSPHISHQRNNKPQQQQFRCKFIIEGTAEPSAKDLVSRMLPLCDYYIFINDFIQSRSNYEWGMINHAFCTAVESLMKEYLILVAQLESQFKSRKLTLQKMWFYLQPSLSTFELLYRITLDSQVNCLHGCKVLNHLQIFLNTMASDVKSKELILYLIRNCSVPFIEMLDLWIHRGVIHDPYFEFMVEENQTLEKENLVRDFNNFYWEDRYVLRKEQTPSRFFQDESILEKILTTGKYLNVMRECVGNIKFREFEQLQFTENEKEYAKKIDEAYDYSSSILLNYLINEKQLLPKLKSIKHYFLLCKGDFFSHFMEITYDELKKPLSEINRVKMNSLLQLSLRTSSISSDDPVSQDDLECEFIPFTLGDQLLNIININNNNGGNGIGNVIINNSNNNIGGSVDQQLQSKDLLGIESLAFNYKVRWPLSIIINRQSMVRYQFIFRHLFMCKHVEKLLGECWNQHQESRRKYSDKPGLTTLLSFSHLLRHRMIHFLQNLEYYMMLEVLEPNWNKMRKSIKESKTVDDVIKLHNDFLERCLTECMLTDTRLVKILMKFMSLCIFFSNFTNQMVHENNFIDTERMKISIEKYEIKFHTIIKLLLDTLRSFSKTESNRHMIHLINRLDYNNYYSKYFESNPNILPTKSISQQQQQPQQQPTKNISFSPVQPPQPQQSQPLQQQRPTTSNHLLIKPNTTSTSTTAVYKNSQLNSTYPPPPQSPLKSNIQPSTNQLLNFSSPNRLIPVPKETLNSRTEPIGSNQQTKLQQQHQQPQITKPILYNPTTTSTTTTTTTTRPMNNYPITSNTVEDFTKRLNEIRRRDMNGTT
eukprot:gene9740-11961_t